MSVSSPLLSTREVCRLCGSRLSEVLVSFASLPVAGTYADPKDAAPEPLFPLTFARCPACGLPQLKESLAPSFYTQYRFLSGVPAGYRAHLTAIADDLRTHLPGGGRVLEIGASDGTLLDLLRNSGFEVAGFEPASEPAKRAQLKGLAVVESFFNRETAALCRFRLADVVIIRHVLEHIDDFAAIFDGVKRLASPKTLLVVEVPDLTSTVELSIYSNVYHIHPCYFEITSMTQLLALHGWYPMGSKVVNVFGGSLFLWANQTPGGRPEGLSFPNVPGTTPKQLNRAELADFAAAWKERSSATRRFFDDLRVRGAKVAGYGAAERTTSLLGTAGLTSSHISAIYDRNPALDELAMPGSRIPIRHPEHIPEDRPDYLVLFARSFEEEIMRELGSFHAAGGRFISTRTLPPTLITDWDGKPGTVPAEGK